MKKHLNVAKVSYLFQDVRENGPLSDWYMGELAGKSDHLAAYRLRLLSTKSSLAFSDQIYFSKTATG